MSGVSDGESHEAMGGGRGTDVAGGQWRRRHATNQLLDSVGLLHVIYCSAG